MNVFVVVDDVDDVVIFVEFDGKWFGKVGKVGYCGEDGLEKVIVLVECHVRKLFFSGICHFFTPLVIFL